MAPELNTAQRAVVESEAQRIVVSAGAGSGKTRTLVERFVDRVLRFERQGLDDVMRRILLITFTEKAAGELVERVRGRLLEAGRPDLARAVDESWISTIHGFCNRIVRRHALELGVDPGFTVLGETEAGIARTAAFESAALALAGDPEVDRLVQEWSIATLRESILRGHDTARSKGRLVTDLLPVPPGDIRGPLRSLIDTTRQLLPEYREYGSSATGADNVDTFERRAAAAAQALAALAEGAGLADDSVREPLDSILGGKAAKRGSARAKELIEELNGLVTALRGAVIDAVAAQDSRGWLKLLGAFDERYTGAKADVGALDFEDLQLLTRRLWVQRPEAAQRYARQFLEVMIDEFQDTNQLQVEATGPVIGTRACYVGDVQQSIYGFRDADVTLLRDLFDGASGDDDAAACKLTVNYRTHPQVLHAINEIFSNAVFSGSRHQSLDHEAEAGVPDSWPEAEPRVEVIVADKSACDSGTWRDVEAAALAARLRAIVDAGWCSAGEIVVLTRAATKMGLYASALEAEGFEVLAPAAGGFYGTREVADMRAFLKVLANPLDTEGVIGLLAGGLGGVSDDALLLLALNAAEDGPWGAMEHADELGVSDADRDRIQLVHGTVERLRKLQGRIRLADAILHAAAVLGCDGGLLGEPAGWANTQKLARIAAEFESSTPADPAAFLEHLEQREQFVKKESVGVTAAEGADAIRLMTVHAAKGLEFPVVVVADLGHSGVHTIPDVILASDGDVLRVAVRGPKDLRCESGDGSSYWKAAAVASASADRDEENRVFYVACTRAQRALLLTGSRDTNKPLGDSTMIERLLTAVEQGASGVRLTAVDPGEGAESPGEAYPQDHDLAPSSDDLASEETRGEAPVPAVQQVAVDGGHRRLEPLPEPEDIQPPAEMSYTAFALYESCAYRFFSERMLRVGSVGAHDGENPLALGTAVHTALELIARGETVDTARLEAISASGGLSTAQHSRLSTAVAAVLDSDVADLIEAGTPEVDFAVDVSGVVVRGSMDLLVRSGGTATVLDYKTGTEWDVEQGRYRAQAEIYAFALLSAGMRSVDVRFVHVEAGCAQESFRFNPQDADAIRSRLERSLERMRAGQFPRLAAFHGRYCADCPVSGGLCPVVHPGHRRR